MTWTPPPESERPDGYKCLARVEIYEDCSIWTEVVWEADGMDEPYWFIPIVDCDLGQSVEEPAIFAPLPEATTARIAALEAEVARLTAWQAKAENALKHAQAFLDDEHPKWEEHQILGIDCLWKLIREAIAKPEQAGGPTND
jgi:uncharacterized small protein (DUF1192 family)